MIATEPMPSFFLNILLFGYSTSNNIYRLVNVLTQWLMILILTPLINFFNLFGSFAINFITVNNTTKGHFFCDSTRLQRLRIIWILYLLLFTNLFSYFSWRLKISIFFGHNYQPFLMSKLMYKSDYYLSFKYSILFF